MKMLKIAVLGAGFSGMATAYFLAKYAKSGVDLEITILDPGEVGENASGISAGLLHTYAGAHAKLVKNGVEGQAATLELADVAQQASELPVSIKTGLLRMAISDQQKEDFRACAEKFEDVHWYGKEECQKVVTGVVEEPGIFIESAYIIKTKQYLEGLWCACNKLGVSWIKKEVSSLGELEGFDAMIVACGANTTSLPELSHLPIRPVKGQILEIRWPEQLPLLKLPVNSKAYIVQGSASNTIIVGATFEREFHSTEPDLESALNYLKPKMSDIFPDLQTAKILECRSGLRASTPNHLPISSRESSKVWVLAGMGSKGLLYHALYSKKLVDDVMKSLVPSAFS